MLCSWLPRPKARARARRSASRRAGMVIVGAATASAPAKRDGKTFGGTNAGASVDEFCCSFAIAAAESERVPAKKAAMPAKRKPLCAASIRIFPEPTPAREVLRDRATLATTRRHQPPRNATPPAEAAAEAPSVSKSSILAAAKNQRVLDSIATAQHLSVHIDTAPS